MVERLYAEASTDTMENMLYSIESRIKMKSVRMLNHIAHGETTYLQNGGLDSVLAMLSDVYDNMIFR